MAADHGKVCPQRPGQQNQRPQQVSFYSILPGKAEQQKQNRKGKQQGQGIVFEHIQAGKKAHGVPGQQTVVIAEAAGTVKVTARGDEQSKPNQRPRQAGRHPSRQPALPLEHNSAGQHQTNQHSGAGILA